MAKKFYKNLTGRVLNIPLYGKGVVHIAADAECIALDEAVADSINNMTYVAILEETTPKLTENPIAKAPKQEDIEEIAEEKAIATVAKRRNTSRKK